MYISIPVALCQWAITNKYIAPFKLFVYLKAISNGKMKISQYEMQTIAEALEYKSRRAVKNNLNLLIRDNWVGCNKTTGVYFIRGFDKIMQIKGFKSSTGAEFDTHEIRKFKAFIAGVVIGYMVNYQKRQRRVTGLKTGSPNHITRQSSDYCPVANLAISKILGVSISTAFSLKQLAEKEGYIIVKKMYTETGVNGIYKKLYMQTNPDVAHKVIILKNQVVIQDIDMVKPTILFNRRKNLESYKLGYRVNIVN